MSPSLRWSALPASLLLLTSLGVSAPLTSDAEYDDVTMIVTAERVEQPVSESIATVTVVSAEEIREQGAITVADAIRTVPGVTIRQAGQLGALACVSIRGALPNQTLVLVNGQPISSAAVIGGTDLARFPVTDVERIEVVRGTASSLYGSDAIGGVINIITKRPEENGGTVTLGYGSHGRAERSVLLNGVTPAVDWQLSGSFPAYDGTRPNSDFDAHNLSATLVLPNLAGWHLQVRGEDYRDNLGVPGADYTDSGYSDPDDRVDWERTLGTLNARRGLGAGELVIGASRLQQEMLNLTPGLDWMTYEPTTYRSQVQGTTDTLDLTYTRPDGDHRWSVGGAYRRDQYANQELQDGVTQSTQDVSSRIIALYTQDRWAVSPTTDVVAGVRFDDYSDAGSRLSPRLGAYQQLSPDMVLRASYGEGFRAPTLVERFYNAFGFSGNPDLKPESSRQMEVGATWEYDGGSVDVTAFRNTTKNQITWAGLTYENTDRARQQGVEVAWTTRLAARTNVTVGYTYLDAINETTGARLLRTPRNEVSLTATHAVRAWDFALTGLWRGERLDYGGFDPDTYAPLQTTLPARTVWNLTITHADTAGVRPYVIVRNLTDERKPELAGYPVEGRSLEGGIRASW